MYPLKNTGLFFCLTVRTISCPREERKSLRQASVQEPNLRARGENKYYPSLEDQPALNDLQVMEPPADYQPSYLDLRSDFAFKHIFGREANKHLLLHFLNSLFEGRKIISDLQLGPTERQGELKETRKVLFDLQCKGDKGEQFLIEMQRERQDNFLARLMHYLFRLGSEQVPAGKKGDNYPLPEINAIAIMDFNPWEGIDVPPGIQNEYVNSYGFRHIKTCDPYPVMVELTLVELPKFTKVIADLQTNLDKWLYVIKNPDPVKNTSPLLDEPWFRNLLQITEIKKIKKEDRTMLIDYERDQRNIRKVWKREARKEGLEEGRQEGRIEGRQEGLKEGLKEGIAEGEQRMKELKELTFVQALVKKIGFSDQEIADLAGVEEGFVRKVRAESAIAV